MESTQVSFDMNPIPNKDWSPLSVILGDKDGNFRCVEKTKSHLFSACALAYSGLTLKNLIQDSFYFLEKYVEFYEELHSNENKDIPPVIFFNKDFLFFQWDANSDPVIRLYKDKIQVFYKGEDKMKWNVAEAAHPDDRKKSLDEGMDIVRKVKMFHLDGKLPGE